MKTTIRKRITAVVAAVLVSTATATTTATAVTPPYRLGDVDGDGMVTASDASAVLRYYTELSSGVTPTVFPHPEGKHLADVDRDGKITGSDASAILRYYCDESSGVEPQWPDFIFEVGHRYLPLVEVPTSKGLLKEPFLVVSHKGNLVWIYVQSWGQFLFYLEEEGVDPLQSQSDKFVRLD